jgi:hypothetical protein
MCGDGCTRFRALERAVMREDWRDSSMTKSAIDRRLLWKIVKVDRDRPGMWKGELCKKILVVFLLLRAILASGVFGLSVKRSCDHFWEEGLGVVTKMG